MIYRLKPYEMKLCCFTAVINGPLLPSLMTSIIGLLYMVILLSSTKLSIFLFVDSYQFKTATPHQHNWNQQVWLPVRTRSYALWPWMSNQQLFPLNMQYISMITVLKSTSVMVSGIHLSTISISMMYAEVCKVSNSRLIVVACLQPIQLITVL